MRKRKSRYDWLMVAPDAKAGMKVLFEALHDGWEPVLTWREKVGKSEENLILLRRPWRRK